MEACSDAVCIRCAIDSNAFKVFLAAGNGLVPLLVQLLSSKSPAISALAVHLLLQLAQRTAGGCRSIYKSRGVPLLIAGPIKSVEDEVYRNARQLLALVLQEQEHGQA